MSDPDAVRGHLDHLAWRGLREATRYQRRRVLARLRGYSAVSLDGRPLLDLGTEHLVGWLSRRLEPQSRATEISHLRGFYRWAHETELIDRDRSLRLHRPRLPRRLPRPIRDTDLARALNAADGDLRVWLLLGAYCGLRAGEIAALRGENIGDGLVVVDGKGGHQGAVPIPAHLADALAGLPRRGPCFTLRDGRQLPAYRVSQRACAHLHELGIPDTFHSLRHWYATQIYRASHDLRLTQELLRHVSPVTTAGYTLLDPTDGAKVVACLPMMGG